MPPSVPARSEVDRFRTKAVSVLGSTAMPPVLSDDDGPSPPGVDGKARPVQPATTLTPTATTDQPISFDIENLQKKSTPRGFVEALSNRRAILSRAGRTPAPAADLPGSSACGQDIQVPVGVAGAPLQIRSDATGASRFAEAAGAEG
jgi:hypothetical protein